MRSADATTALCRVDASLCATDNLSIPKVVLEGIVVGEKQSRSAYPRKRENVLVIGAAYALGSNRRGF